MSGKEKTPGQAAYGAAREPAAIGWETLSPEARVRWEAIAAAGSADLAAELAAVTAGRDEACEQSAVIRERLGQYAARLERSAQATSPSRKSEIERGCAQAVRAIAAGDREPAP